MEKFRETGKRVLDNLDEKRSDILHKWEDKSREFIHSFLLLFGKEGRMAHIWNESRGRILKALSPPSSPGTSRDGSSSEDDDEMLPSKRRRLHTSDYSDDEDEDELQFTRNNVSGLVPSSLFPNPTLQ